MSRQKFKQFCLSITFYRTFLGIPPTYFIDNPFWQLFFNFHDFSNFSIITSTYLIRLRDGNTFMVLSAMKAVSHIPILCHDLYPVNFLQSKKKLIDNNSISMNFLSLRAISKLSIFCCLNVPVSDFIFRK